MKKIIFALLSISALLLLIQIQIFACSCPFNPQIHTQKQQIEMVRDNSKVIFSGTVIEVTDNSKISRAFVKFRVGHFWKGETSKEITIATRNDEGGCGYSFEIGKTYLVYAYNYRLYDSVIATLHTDRCHRNNELSKAGEDLKILGKGKKPKRQKL